MVKSRLGPWSVDNVGTENYQFELHQPFNFWDEFAVGVRFDDLNPRFKFVGRYGLLSGSNVFIVDVYLRELELFDPDKMEDSCWLTCSYKAPSWP